MNRTRAAAAPPSVIGGPGRDFTVCGDIVRRAAARNVSFRDASGLGHLISNAQTRAVWHL
jgi:hypothetical protein